MFLIDQKLNVFIYIHNISSIFCDLFIDPNVTQLTIIVLLTFNLDNMKIFNFVIVLLGHFTVLVYTTSTNKTKEAFLELFKRTIIGYDCSEISNVSSHKVSEFDTCEQGMYQKVTKSIDVQILQRSNKFTNPDLTCSLRRTRKLSHCGKYHHGLPLYSEEKTFEKTFVKKKRSQLKLLSLVALLTLFSKHVFSKHETYYFLKGFAF